MDGTITGTATLNQSGPGSNGYKMVLHTSQNQEFELHNRIQFKFFLRIPHFLRSQPEMQSVYVRD